MGMFGLVRRGGPVAAERRSRDQIRSDSQSTGFATDICVVLRGELETREEVRLTLLDAEARTATGSNLMAQVFHQRRYSQMFSFDERFFSEHQPDRLVVYRSPHWSSGDCFMAVHRTAT